MPHDNEPRAAPTYIEPRPAGRGTVITATALAVLILVMYVVGTVWSLLAGAAVFVAVHNYDRRVRPGQAVVPLIAYVVGIYGLAIVAITVAAIVLVGVAMILP